MQLTDLRPCDACGGPVAPSFYVLRVSQALVDHRAARELWGLTQFFGGTDRGLMLASAFTAREGVLVFGDKDPQLMQELLVCQSCLLKGPLDVALLLEKRAQADETSAPPEGKRWLLEGRLCRCGHPEAYHSPLCTNCDCLEWVAP